MSELALINMNLPARIWLPIYDFPHHIVRIPYRSAAVLNSKEKVRNVGIIENIFTIKRTQTITLFYHGLYIFTGHIKEHT